MKDENNGIFGDLISKLFNKSESNSDYNARMRQKLHDALNDESMTQPSDEELQLTMQQFSTYITMQLLQYIALKDHADKANAFMTLLVDDFIQQKRSHAAIQIEVDAIEQKDTTLSKILSEELMQKERELVTKRLDNLYTQFEKKVKSIILVKENDLPKHGDNNGLF